MTTSLLTALRQHLDEVEDGSAAKAVDHTYISFHTPFDPTDTVRPFENAIPSTRRAIKVTVRPYYEIHAEADIAVISPPEYVFVFREKLFRRRYIWVYCTDPIPYGVHCADITYIEPTNPDTASGHWYPHVASFTSHHLMKPLEYPHSVTLPSRLVP